MDRNPGVPEYGGTDHVAFLDSRKSSLDVFACFTGRNGPREYTLGGARDTLGLGEYNGLLGSGIAAGISNDPETPLERTVS